ncbi:hypothetical protein [Sorangium sp. So ce1099]|uniref:hypothetical protein n=1 Tax=Sorangium sp. So ce1099 TaxID=3133331 RepID=UPI003F62F37C
MPTDEGGDVDLDRLLALWSARADAPEEAAAVEPAAGPDPEAPGAPATRDPAALLAEVEPAAGPDPEAPGAPATRDPAALLAELEHAIEEAFGRRSKEFAILRPLFETDPHLDRRKVPIEAMNVAVLVQIMFPADGGPPREEIATYRDRMRQALDDLEDLLAGLMVAAEVSGR